MQDDERTIQEIWVASKADRNCINLFLKRFFSKLKRNLPQKFSFHLCHSENENSPLLLIFVTPRQLLINGSKISSLIHSIFQQSPLFSCNFLTGSDKCKIGEANRRYSQRETKGPFLHNSCPISAHDISWQ